MIISHPTGNQNVRNAALAFHRANLLDRFYTTVAWRSDVPWAALLPPSVRVTLRRREYAMLPKDRLSTHPMREACRLVAERLKLEALTKHEVGPCSIDAVYRDLDAHVARKISRVPPPVRRVYAYEDGALKTFEAAKRLGIATIYEVASAYWRAGGDVFAQEAQLNAEWAVTINALGDSDEKRARRDAEIALADKVVVASSFTASNLAVGDFTGKSIAVVPYGAPPPVPRIRRAERGSGPLKALFVGGLSQAKGLSYLFDALDLLGDKVSLTVIGRRNRRCRPLDRHLERCRYIPSLPHDDVLREMELHDVLVFPSLWDGFGLVILEAMSRGLPVIASTNCGGPDVITDGVDGFIVPIRSAEAVAEKLELLAADVDRLNEMKDAALRAAHSYSWERYRAALVSHVI